MWTVFTNILHEKRAKPVGFALILFCFDSMDLAVALEFAAEAVKIAPCYYVSGNHESRIEEYETFKQDLLDLGVTVLENEKVEFHRSGETVSLMGVIDPSFEADYWQVFPEDVMDKNVGDLCFVFQRGDIFTKDQVVYIDNLRARKKV